MCSSYNYYGNKNRNIQYMFICLIKLGLKRVLYEIPDKDRRAYPVVYLAAAG